MIIFFIIVMFLFKSSTPYFIEQDLADDTPLTMVSDVCSRFDKEVTTALPARSLCNLPIHDSDGLFDPHLSSLLHNYLDVRIKKRGDMMSVDMYRRTASTQNSIPDDDMRNDDVRTRRSLPSILKLI